MADLANALQQYKAAELERNDRALAFQLATVLPPLVSELDDQTLRRLAIFSAYCADRGVLLCPAQPATVASFIIAQVAKGERAERIFELTVAIELLHDQHGLANPVATAIARRALASLGVIEPPRSWRPNEKMLFSSLPLEIQTAVARREHEREKEIRRMQNATAEKLRQPDGAELKPTNKSEEDLKNDNTQAA